MEIRLFCGMGRHPSFDRRDDIVFQKKKMAIIIYSGKQRRISHFGSSAYISDYINIKFYLKVRRVLCC